MIIDVCTLAPINSFLDVYIQMRFCRAFHEILVLLFETVRRQSNFEEKHKTKQHTTIHIHTMTLLVEPPSNSAARRYSSQSDFENTLLLLDVDYNFQQLAFEKKADKLHKSPIKAKRRVDFEKLAKKLNKKKNKACQNENLFKQMWGYEGRDKQTKKKQKKQTDRVSYFFDYLEQWHSKLLKY
jgi:hypothetical protein